MNGLPYYKAYPRDFVEGTIGMPFEVKCAYRVVIDLIYMQGGNLPDDARYISGLLGCSIRKWKTIRLDLIGRAKIHVSGEFLTNKRADKELETLAKLQETQRENASGPRKNKGLEKPPLNQPEPEPDIKERDTNVSTKKKRASRLPDDWQIPKEYGEWALSQGYAEIVVRLEAEKFKDYWISASGRNAAKLDWLATWRNWMRNSSKTAPTPNGRTKGHDAFNAQIAAGARWDRERAMDRGTDRNSVIPLLPAGRAGGGQRGSND